MNRAVLDPRCVRGPPFEVVHEAQLKQNETKRNENAPPLKGNERFASLRGHFPSETVRGPPFEVDVPRDSRFDAPVDVVRSRCTSGLTLRVDVPRDSRFDAPRSLLGRSGLLLFAVIFRPKPSDSYDQLN